MFRFTITVHRGTVPADAVKVRSTLDRTQGLALGTAEAVVVGTHDVTVVRNDHAEHSAHLHLTGLRMHRDGFIVCQPSRQQSFKLWNGRSIDVTLGPEESMVIRSHIARDPQAAPLSDTAHRL